MLIAIFKGIMYMIHCTAYYLGVEAVNMISMSLFIVFLGFLLVCPLATRCKDKS